MADTHSHGDHHASLFRMYMTIAVVLAVCTASSFVVNQMVYGHTLSPFMGFVLILGVAILKATLVGLIFMHLKWDWNLLYFIIVPSFILATMMAIVFLPDCVIGAGREADEAVEIARIYGAELEQTP